MMTMAVEQHRLHNDGTLVCVNHKSVCAVFLADIADRTSEVGIIAHSVLPGE